MLKSFAVENFKGFSGRQEIELAPLTLFFGQNSSGKSTLLRVLPWLAESMLDKRPGPCLDGEVAREATWDDMVNAQASSAPVHLELQFESGASVQWSIRGGHIRGTCEIAKITCGTKDGSATLSDDGDHVWQGSEGPVDARLEGMLPQGKSPGSLPAPFVSLQKELETVRVQWVTGVRAPVGRVVGVGGTPPFTLGSDGHNAARHLYFWDRLGLRDRRRTALADFFSRMNCEVTTEDVSQRGGWFRVILKPLEGTGLPVNVVDTGEGFTQVLPALVALGRAEAKIGPNIVAVEQPELHLHTNAQRALAETLVAAVERGGVQVLAETHSEVLLASIQLAVAKGQLPHESVIIYWVSVRPDGSSVAYPVKLDPKGRVSGPWPVDAFADLLELRTELHRARREPR